MDYTGDNVWRETITGPDNGDALTGAAINDPSVLMADRTRFLLNVTPVLKVATATLADTVTATTFTNVAGTGVTALGLDVGEVDTHDMVLEYTVQVNPAGVPGEMRIVLDDGSGGPLVVATGVTPIPGDSNAHVITVRGVITGAIVNLPSPWTARLQARNTDVGGSLAFLAPMTFIMIAWPREV